MFKSYNSKYLGYDQESYKYEITIIDSSFEETIATYVPHDVSPFVENHAAIVAIKIYSIRNLNVVKNLFLLFKYIESRFIWSIKDQYEWCQKHIPEYNQYHEGVKKLLLFS